MMCAWPRGSLTIWSRLRAYVSIAAPTGRCYHTFSSATVPCALVTPLCPPSAVSYILWCYVWLPVAGMSAAGSDPQLAQGIEDGPDLFLEDTIRYARRVWPSPMYHCTTVPLYHYTTVPLYLCASVPLYLVGTMRYGMCVWPLWGEG